MAAKTKKVDHGFREIKWLLRQRLLAMIAPRVAVDFYAGQGLILDSLYRNFERVHAVEKDPDKYARLAAAHPARPGPGAAPRVMTYCMDNREFARTKLQAIPGITLMDFDAYGNPHPLISQVFGAWRPKQTAVIAVTDGARMGIVRGNRIRLQNYQPGAVPENTPAAATPPLCARHYELLVRSFWGRLARARDFSVLDFITAWNKKRMVMYYGLRIEPN